MTLLISLKNFADLKNYANLLEKFSFSGYMRGQSFLVDASDILAIFNHCPAENMELILTEITTEDCTALQKYLSDIGLLIP